MTKNPIPDLMTNRIKESLEADKKRLEELSKTVKGKKAMLKLLSKEAKPQVPFFRTNFGQRVNRILSWATRGAANTHHVAETKLRSPDLYEYIDIYDELDEVSCDAILLDNALANREEKKTRKTVNKLAELHLRSEEFLGRQKTLSVEERARLISLNQKASDLIKSLRPEEEPGDKLLKKLKTISPEVIDFGTHGALLGLPVLTEEKDNVEHGIRSSDSDDSGRTGSLPKTA